MLGAIWSVTPHIEDLCKQLAGQGIGAIAPCLFRGIGIPARDAPPEVLKQTFLEFDDRRCVRDLRAVLRATAGGRFGAAGALVPWGFCLGGRFAHLLAAVSEHVAGAVNCYGRLRFARQPTKPFLPIELTGLIEVPYLGHFAETDELIPQEDVLELRHALAERGVPHAVHVYRGARHGFFDPERPTEHDPRAAALAWTRTLEFLAGIGAR
jgi:carboxymethylenebutenolidase